MFYYLYEIRNNLNDKIYVGVHKTKDMNDGYMGSGKVIIRAIEKHGIDNFTKVILEAFENEEAMYAREKFVVNNEFLSRENVYNIRRGGFGGFDYINNFPEIKHNATIECSRKGGKTAWLLHRDKFLKNLSNTNKSRWLADKKRMLEISKLGLLAAMSPEANEQRKLTMKNNNHQIGNKNSQFGTLWITNGKENKKIKKNDHILDGWRRGRVINK